MLARPPSPGPLDTATGKVPQLSPAGWPAPAVTADALLAASLDSLDAGGILSEAFLRPPAEAPRVPEAAETPRAPGAADITREAEVATCASQRIRHT